MKNNYKPSDKVTIKKQGHFFGLQGEVITHNTETQFKPLYVNLGEQGRWSFNYEDLCLTGKENDLKTVDNAVLVDKLKKVEAKTAKRPYKKRDKSEPIKQKRAYNKKVKQ